MRGAFWCAALLTLSLAACGDAPQAEPAETEPPAWVEELAQVANAIQARPAAADSILAANDLTRARLDSLLYRVAADPELTRAYQEARGR